jgi:hypothetical protein
MPQVLADNPLADFVELPEEYKGELRYSGLLCGVIRGALEMVRGAFVAWARTVCRCASPARRRRMHARVGQAVARVAGRTQWPVVLINQRAAEG